MLDRSHGRCGDRESVTEEMERLREEHILKEKIETRAVIKTVRQLLRRKKPAFIHIMGNGICQTYVFLQDVLLIGYNSKAGSITVLAGLKKGLEEDLEEKTISLMGAGENHIKEIKEIEPREILLILKRLQRHLTEIRASAKDFANEI